MFFSEQIGIIFIKAENEVFGTVGIGSEAEWLFMDKAVICLDGGLLWLMLVISCGLIAVLGLLLDAAYG